MQRLSFMSQDSFLGSAEHEPPEPDYALRSIRRSLAAEQHGEEIHQKVQEKVQQRLRQRRSMARPPASSSHSAVAASSLGKSGLKRTRGSGFLPPRGDEEGAAGAPAPGIVGPPRPRHDFLDGEDNPISSIQLDSQSDVGFGNATASFNDGGMSVSDFRGASQARGAPAASQASAAGAAGSAQTPAGDIADDGVREEDFLEADSSMMGTPGALDERSQADSSMVGTPGAFSRDDAGEDAGDEDML